MIKRKNSLIKLGLILIIFFPLCALANDMGNFVGGSIANPVLNPSAVYCEKLGYEFVIKDTPDGQLGICKISDTVEVPAWKFLQGKEAVEYNYCSQEGYKTKITSDPEKCVTSSSRECSVCILSDGREIEALDLISRGENAVGQINDVDEKQNEVMKVEEGLVLENNTFLDSKNLKYMIIGVLIAVFISLMWIIYWYLHKNKHPKDNIPNDPNDIDNW